ncbi:MAG: hypothetical protein M0P64_04350 [Candidatus Pacebacteria bacterium]|jgi:uncharacterized HAD superfamily protein|nr:hypothetical protein [Candidatus Paceibacterota bacterium]
MGEILKIGLDLDDVLLATNDAMLKWHNRVYGTSYARKDIVTWELTKVWNCTFDEMLSRIHEFYASPEHDETLAFKGAIEGIETLGEGKEYHIITSRPGEMHGKTMALIQKYFPPLVESVHFTSQVTEEAGRSRKKEHVCLELGIQVFVEDNLDYARNVAGVEIPVLLFDTPWNQTEDLPSNVTRVYSWEEIVEKLI